ncbi:MAG TPA: ribonuclease domain-containing protein [Rhodocyclaceae bacterium]
MMRVLLALLFAFLATAAAAGDVAIADLPPEARTTLRLIDAGGPFPYRRDGVVFANREHRLPEEPRGYYREYTVPTPGAYDRGARRIIAGSRGERYYTGDHYRSFLRIRE